MANFPNGTAGEMYEEQYCARCVHGENDPGKRGCPVMLAHVLYAYELCNEKDHPGKHILDLLIPERADGFPAQCSMFVNVETVRRKRQDRRQAKLFGGDDA